MSRTIECASVKHYHYHRNDQLCCLLRVFVLVYNFARRVKNLARIILRELKSRVTWSPERYRARGGGSAAFSRKRLPVNCTVRQSRPRACMKLWQSTAT